MRKQYVLEESAVNMIVSLTEDIIGIANISGPCSDMKELKEKFIGGMSSRAKIIQKIVNETGDERVIRTGTDESDTMRCPRCGWIVGVNDDFGEERPNYCPNCGKKLIY